MTKDFAENTSTEVCFIKHVTNMSCPSCGSTRSVISLTKGDFVGALTLNPIGYLGAIIMLIVPVWVLIDIVMKGNTLFNAYQKMEAALRKPKYAVPLVILVIVNWIWNITKGL